MSKSSDVGMKRTNTRYYKDECIKMLKWVFVVIILSFTFVLGGCATMDSQLFTAIKEDDVYKVKTLLSKGANVNAKNEVGATPLMAAAARGNTELLKLLIDHGANVNAKNDFGETPLMYAAREGKVESMKLLIDYGANVNDVDKWGETPLMYAIDNHKITGIQAIYMSKEAGLKSVPDKVWALVTASVLSGLLSSLFYDKMRGVELLIDHGADVNAKDAFGHTPLMHAAIVGEDEIVRFLIEHGATVNERSFSGATPLMLTISFANLTPISLPENAFRVAKILIEHGADVNAKDYKGESALDYAERHPNENKDIIKLLEEHGAR